MIVRKLQDDLRDKIYEQHDLLGIAEPIVVLGDAGMGKTTLTEWLETMGYARCTARQLINSHDPSQILKDSPVLVIDALDEVSAQREGEAVDRVLQKLGEMGYPAFILSCRAAEWRNATGVEAIREQYGNSPLAVRLLPFDRDDARAFLVAQLGRHRGEDTLERFSAKNVAGLLGNPQTLGMIAEVAKTSDLPDGTGELFDQFVEVAWCETNQRKTVTALQGLGKTAVLDALGAAYAALILTGKEAISRSQRVDAHHGDLPLAEVAALPDAGNLPKVLESRLAVYEADRFTFPHRRVGEFLGARWLAAQADTPIKRRRLLKLFHAHELVPASLRGLHAWLGHHSSDLAADVIRADPMGLIEYGDADRLSVGQARLLLEALEALAREDPRFHGWGHYSARGIAKEPLVPELRRLITNPDTPVGLQALIVEQLVGSEAAPKLADELRQLLLAPEAVYSSRSASGKALANLETKEDWPSIIRQLVHVGDDESLRLGLELLDRLNYEAIDDELIVALLIARATVESRMAGRFYQVERRLSDDRLQGVLDLFAAEIPKLGKRFERPGNDALTDVAYRFIARRVALGGVSAQQLWTWLEPFDANVGYAKEERKQLSDRVRADEALLRDLQRLIILDQVNDKDIWQRAWRLNDRLPGAAPIGNEDDVVALLEALDPKVRSDERWRQVLTLARHSATDGAKARQVAHAFAAHNPDLSKWIEGLQKERKPEWQLREEQRERKLKAKRELSWREHRADFAKHIDAMRNGDYGVLVNPAKAYLKLFSDIGDQLPASERVSEWLGPELAEAAHQGFRAFLVREPFVPTAKQMADSFAEMRHWEAGYIIVAALAERYRTNEGFDTVPDERIVAALYELLHTRVDQNADLPELMDLVEEEVRSRGLWEQAMRGWIEPQLENGRDHLDGLYQVMSEGKDAEFGSRLAVEWLTRFPDLSASAEAEMLDRLIRSDDQRSLRDLINVRLGGGFSDDERRRNWDAIQFWVDFESAEKRLAADGPVEPALLWNLRDRLGGARHSDRESVLLSPRQSAWIVRNFRKSWKAASWPTGGWSGDTNDWDASDYLFGVINRLADDTSDAARIELTRLRDETVDSYTDHLRAVTVEQQRKRVEVAFEPPSLEQVSRVLSDKAPAIAADLQAVIVEELNVLRRQLIAGGDPAEPHRGFYQAGNPADEEWCRDHLLLLLRGRIPFGIELRPEGHAADDKEIDIECSLGPNLMVPIEVKGQWNRDLWSAADTQLARLYTGDWRAEKRGIYLVLWFGDQGKKLKKPPHGIPTPDSADQLRDALIAVSPAASDGLVEVIVFDVSRPGGST